MSDQSFSRGTTLGLGKCTATLKTLAPEDLKDAFVRKSRELGYDSESDCLRDLVAIWVLGADEVMKVHADRVRRMSTVVTEPER